MHDYRLFYPYSNQELGSKVRSLVRMYHENLMFIYHWCSFTGKDLRNTIVSWELKVEVNISKMCKKIILKICCSFVITSEFQF